jgi:hypothetical protein
MGVTNGTGKRIRSLLFRFPPEKITRSVTPILRQHAGRAIVFGMRASGENVSGTFSSNLLQPPLVSGNKAVDEATGLAG